MLGMCGRFTRNYTWRQIHEMYALTGAASNLQPRFNICPTTTVDAVVEVEGARHLVPMRWGIIPNWWSKPLKELKLATCNARAETVAVKPMFRDAFRRNRCILPASGYYEWHDTPGGKQPFYFTRRDGAVMTIAGLWDEWRDRATGETIKSCAMIITEPNKFVAEVHDRMPVVLEREQIAAWLTASVGREALRPAAEDVLAKIPVSKRVNSSRADDNDASLIERVELGPKSDADALASLMKDPENIVAIGDLLGQFKSN